MDQRLSPCRTGSPPRPKAEKLDEGGSRAREKYRLSPQDTEMNFARRSADLVPVQVRAPQTFTIMLLSVAERFLSKPFEHLLHPAQKLSLGKMGFMVSKQTNRPLKYDLCTIVPFLQCI